MFALVSVHIDMLSNKLSDRAVIAERVHLQYEREPASYVSSQKPRESLVASKGFSDREGVARLVNDDSTESPRRSAGVFAGQG